MQYRGIRRPTTPGEHSNVIDRITERATESQPCAKVWEEERHGSLPGWLVRPFYRVLKAPLLWICTRNQIDADMNGDARRRRRADPNDNNMEET